MRRLVASVLFVPLALAYAGGSVLAGGHECEKAAAAANVAKEHKKCTMGKDDCVKAMAEAKTRGWLGIEAEGNEDGSWSITKVVPASPAANAGLRSGDVILAMNGVTLGEANADKLKAIKKDLKPGSSVTYNVRRDGKEENVSAVLGLMPAEVYTAWVNEHMKEHTDIASK